MVPNMCCLPNLSPRGFSGSFRLNENFFSGVALFDFCAEKDSFSNNIGGPSRGVLIVADLKQRPNWLDTSVRKLAARSKARVYSVTPITTTTYATEKTSKKTLHFFSQENRDT
jgi:hypothetical protein